MIVITLQLRHKNPRPTVLRTNCRSWWRGHPGCGGCRGQGGGGGGGQGGRGDLHREQHRELVCKPPVIQYYSQIYPHLLAAASSILFSVNFVYPDSHICWIFSLQIYCSGNKNSTDFSIYFLLHYESMYIYVCSHGIMGRRFPDGGLLRYRKWVP